MESLNDHVCLLYMLLTQTSLKKEALFAINIDKYYIFANSYFIQL